VDDKNKPNKPQPQPEKKSEPMPQNPKQAPQPNEGEGNKSADKQYRQGVREFEEQHDTESLGRSAKRDIEREPGGYQAAENEGRRRMAEEDPELYRKGEKK
jgi:hypothetical protein